MHPIKKEHQKIKPKLHPRNRHRERYDFKELISSFPDLGSFVKLNVHGDESVDFFDPAAVRALNTALLRHYYGIKDWYIPQDYLCPPIPGRADYIHYMADLLSGSNFGETPVGEKVRCLDIGVGANCIYPIIGQKEYGWSFTGSDIDPLALQSAAKTIESNTHLQGKIELRLQENPKDIFYGLIKPEEHFTLCICNPPFHASAEEARAGNKRKLSNLKKEKDAKPTLNFGGVNSELWCEGGEVWFVREMIRESKNFSSTSNWFSTLISKQTHLKDAYSSLKKAEAVQIKTIPMGQGNKSSRILAWSFLMTKEMQF
ncbi:MAG: 23S rRNA (adenine(1618)-N(6))-methyltransferase RlmF [Bacteroidetes bacterium]|nr:23S rRNA (adenine(1618)-N(6))-methyltransferase RlmF [Bacteroidota bacterium]MBT7093290.1 23S rRNA (adenine(1618)-N(6))-methyltransferase RlmF [Bacteroidota bacterium]